MIFEFKQMTALVAQSQGSLLSQQTAKSLFEIERAQRFEAEPTRKTAEVRLQQEMNKIIENHKDRFTFFDKGASLREPKEVKEEKNKAFILN